MTGTPMKDGACAVLVHVPRLYSYSSEALRELSCAVKAQAKLRCTRFEASPMGDTQRCQVSMVATHVEFDA